MSKKMFAIGAMLMSFSSASWAVAGAQALASRGSYLFDGGPKVSAAPEPLPAAMAGEEHLEGVQPPAASKPLPVSSQKQYMQYDEKKHYEIAIALGAGAGAVVAGIKVGALHGLGWGIFGGWLGIFVGLIGGAILFYFVPRLIKDALQGEKK